MNNIFVCQTVKHFYFSIYASFYFSNKKCAKPVNSLILLCIDHQSIDKSFINVELLRNLGINVVFLSELLLIDEFSKGSFFRSFKLANRNISINFSGIKFISSFLRDKLRDFVSFDDTVYLFHDKTLLSKFFLKLGNVNLIEDGLANYSKASYRASHFKKALRFLTGQDPHYYILGESDSIKKIYLFRKIDVPKEITNKVTFIEQEKFFNCLDVAFDNNLFMFNLSLGVNNLGSYDVVLLTQGLDVAGLCSQSDKLKIYYDLIAYLCSKKKHIALKLHPSEKDDSYNELIAIFNIDVIKDKIPIEALSKSVKGTVISLRTSAENFYGLNVYNLILCQDDWARFNVDEIRHLSMNRLKCIL